MLHEARGASRRRRQEETTEDQLGRPWAIDPKLQGRVHFGLIGDSKRMRNPDAIVRRFAGEFGKSLMIALMED